MLYSILFLTLLNTQIQQVSGDFDPTEHPSGLAYVLSQRTSFNKFLGLTPPTFQREQRIDDALISELRKLSAERYNAQMRKLKELQEKWADADKESRVELIAELIEVENELVAKQLESLDELLPPSRLFALMREYLRSGDTKRLLDPVVSKWLGLTAEEVAKMKVHRQEAQDFLVKSRRLAQDTTKPLPGDLDLEFRKLREQMWTVLPEEKLVRCFRAIGYIGEEQDLTDFLQLYPQRSKILEEESQAFRIARLRLDSKDK